MYSVLLWGSENNFKTSLKMNKSPLIVRSLAAVQASLPKNSKRDTNLDAYIMVVASFWFTLEKAVSSEACKAAASPPARDPAVLTMYKSLLEDKSMSSSSNFFPA